MRQGGPPISFRKGQNAPPQHQPIGGNFRPGYGQPGQHQQQGQWNNNQMAMNQGQHQNQFNQNHYNHPGQQGPSKIGMTQQNQQ